MSNSTLPVVKIQVSRSKTYFIIPCRPLHKLTYVQKGYMVDDPIDV